MRIAKNFRLAEFGIPAEAEERVRRSAWILANTILQPIRDAYGPVVITSGLRSYAQNKQVGGAKSSHHLYLGWTGAADIVFGESIEDRYGGLLLLWNELRHSVGECIVYTETEHIHVSIACEAKKRHFLIKAGDGYLLMDSPLDWRSIDRRFHA